MPPLLEDEELLLEDEDDEEEELLEDDDELLDDELLLELELEPLASVTTEFAGIAYENAPPLTATGVCTSSDCVAEVTKGVTEVSVRPWRLKVWLTERVVLFATTIAKRLLARSLNAVIPIGLVLAVTSTR